MDSKNSNKLPVQQTIDIDDIKSTVMEALRMFKEARKKNGLTTAELSRRAGVSVGVISELESEKKADKDKKVPSLVNFIALTRALGMSEEFVLGTILEYKLCDKAKAKDKYLAMVNNLKDYGIHDDESIAYVMNTLEFVKSRTKNRRI